MKKSCLLFLLLASIASANDVLTFKDRGKELKKLNLSQLQELLKPIEVKIDSPHLPQKSAVHIGFLTTALLDKVYGESWRKRQEVLFTCEDGYQPSVPISYLLQYESFLTYKLDSGAFEIPPKDKDSVPTPLGPYYLIWNNLKQPALKADGTGYWPFQVVSIDLVNFADRFKTMAPPESASADTIRGFSLFRARCMACHTINGEGWKKGVELNYPVSITEYLPEKWLRKWITDPSQMRFNATMPPFDTSSPHWKKDLNDILVYLKTMAKNKKKPI